VPKAKIAWTYPPAPELGGYGAARELFGSAATSVTLTITTNGGGAIVLCTGGKLTDLANAPTDNKGNTYTALGAAEEYADWPGYGIRMWRCLGANGGGNHQFTQVMTQFDESTICAVEVKNAATIQDSAIVERADAASSASPAVTATATAGVIVFWSGDAPVGQTADITPDNGFAILDETTLVDHPNGYVPIAILYATKGAGSHSTNVAVTPTQGAIFGAVALQV
jgi:hypothetical protein